VPPEQVSLFTELHRRANELASQNRRVLLGITGAPGAGKSTLARAIVEDVGEAARLVGMDGFHLPQSRLNELGRQDRKGAIDTFDGERFVALVRQLRDPGENIILAPEFQRNLEESILEAISIEPDVRLVVVEGNYLLVPDPPWDGLRDLFDGVWYCERDENARLADLIARHHAYGKSASDARRWALGSDQRNAELIMTTRSRADVIVRIEGQFRSASSDHSAGAQPPEPPAGGPPR
jgi:pantothenate kinase